MDLRQVHWLVYWQVSYFVATLTSSEKQLLFKKADYLKLNRSGTSVPDLFNFGYKKTQAIQLEVSYHSASRTRTYDIMINSHALLPTELWRIKLLSSKIVRTGFEPVLPPWKGGVLTPWPTDQVLRFLSR